LQTGKELSAEQKELALRRELLAGAADVMKSNGPSAAFESKRRTDFNSVRAQPSVAPTP
jgi:hypothetical protein